MNPTIARKYLRVSESEGFKFQKAANRVQLLANEAMIPVLKAMGDLFETMLKDKTLVDDLTESMKAFGQIAQSIVRIIAPVSRLLSAPIPGMKKVNAKGVEKGASIVDVLADPYKRMANFIDSFTPQKQDTTLNFQADTTVMMNPDGTMKSTRTVLNQNNPNRGNTKRK